MSDSIQSSDVSWIQTLSEVTTATGGSANSSLHSSGSGRWETAPDAAASAAAAAFAATARDCSQGATTVAYAAT
eukprot:CAMPEP_0172696784 /NCGR_PEP_ID=MMETSP1074-20121228/28299_1 /TAXON_ID=2916 /ORGANISM="Ceratium fusus, Strain PA161109" /LENGTH=73 /DNA_ID=CAMNT_0013517587 /DNA_START=83 /DNA_END=301 /DNA_ORIENTATION=-